MRRRLEGDRLVVASHNAGKVRELAELFAPFVRELRAAAELGLPEPEERGATFLDNAALKARSAAALSGWPAVADDSGLVVPALGGAPGVLSARWAGPEELASRPLPSPAGLGIASSRPTTMRTHGAPARSVRGSESSSERDFARAMERVHRELGDGDRAASMVCALALAWPDGHVEAFEGEVEGELVWPPRGALGFGYEPMFRPAADARTYGEMPRADKHADDPRARAFALLRAACLNGR